MYLPPTEGPPVRVARRAQSLAARAGPVPFGVPAAVTARFYSGSALNGVDGKNRLSVPASFREAIEARSGARAVVLAPHARLPALVGYDRSHFARLAEQAERRFGDDFGAEREDFLRETFGAAEDVPYDENGRIILPAILKDMAGIAQTAFFVGASDYFELWAPDAFMAEKGEASLVGRRLAALLKARG